MSRLGSRRDPKTFPKDEKDSRVPTGRRPRLIRPPRPKESRIKCKKRKFLFGPSVRPRCLPRDTPEPGPVVGSGVDGEHPTPEPRRGSRVSLEVVPLGKDREYHTSPDDLPPTSPCERSLVPIGGLVPDPLVTVKGDDLLLPALGDSGSEVQPPGPPFTGEETPGSWGCNVEDVPKLPPFRDWSQYKRDSSEDSIVVQGKSSPFIRAPPTTWGE